MKAIRFIAWGVFTAAIGEFLFGVLIRSDVQGFFSSLIIYIVLLGIAYVIGRWMEVRIRGRFALELTYYLAFATIGLMIEWFVIGNSPWRNPDANQSGMFFFWGAVFTLPRILVAEGETPRHLKRWLRRYLGLQLLGSLAIGLLTPLVYRLFILVWLVILTYAGLQAFIVWNLALSRRADRLRSTQA